MPKLFFPILFLAFTAHTLAADISRNPSIVVADETLFLASVESRSDSILNEYIRKNETLKNWKVLFASRYVRSATSVDEVVMRWKIYVASVNSPGRKLREEPDSSSNDRRFKLVIRPPGDAYLETNQMRFTLSPDGMGVVYYQAAVRVNMKTESEIMDALRKQVAFAAAIKSLAIHPVEKLPIR